MKTQHLSLRTAQGYSFSVSLDSPAGGRPAACALMVHCFPHRSEAEHILSLGLTQNRFEVMRISMSDFEEGMSPQVLQEAYRYLAAERQAPALVVGHSVAGTALMAEAAEWPTVKAIVTIGAPISSQALHALLDEDIDDQEYAHLTYHTGHEIAIDLDMLDILSEPLIHSRLHQLKKALLLMHSPQDKEISVDSAATLYTAARHPKSFVTLDGADHFLSVPGDALYTGNLIASWVQRYVVLPPDSLRTHMEVVARTQSGGFTTEVRAGQHSLLSDEPIKVGGLNLGPSPYDLLNASLGACTTMTLRMYADRKGWPLQEAIVHLKHDKVYGEDCQVCDDPRSMLDRIDREVELIGPLDEQQRRRLMEIADKCPVHKTLSNRIDIVTAEKKE
ncbi:osmc family protein [Flammeovirgaceae bacterium 311]|nr:osmc family protein [Flammeovirgaceae bacterium 311]